MGKAINLPVNEEAFLKALHELHVEDTSQDTVPPCFFAEELIGRLAADDPKWRRRDIDQFAVLRRAAANLEMLMLIQVSHQNRAIGTKTICLGDGRELTVETRLNEGANQVTFRQGQWSSEYDDVKTHEMEVVVFVAGKPVVYNASGPHASEDDATWDVSYSLTPRGLAFVRSPSGVTPENGTLAEGSGQKKKRRGRKLKYDPAADEQIAAAWKSGAYRRYDDLARRLMLDRNDIQAAIDRDRKRQPKRRRKRRGG